MNYIDSLIKYKNTGDAGQCPLCNSQLVVSVYKNDLRESIEVSCPSCNKSELFSGSATKSQK